MKTIAPNGDRILIRPYEEEEKSKSGFKITRDNRNIEMQMGEIMEVGPEAVYKKGDHVLFNPSAGVPVKILEGGRWLEYRIVHDDTVQGLLR